MLILSFDPFSIAIFNSFLPMSGAYISYLMTWWAFFTSIKSQKPSLATTKYLCESLTYIFLMSGTTVSPVFFKG